MSRLPTRGAGVAQLGLPLPPAGRPALFQRGRMLKRWSYIGVYGPELMLCVGHARIGPLPQRWWAIAEPGRPIVERTTVGAGGVSLGVRRARVEAEGARIELELAPDPASEVVEV